MAGQQKLAWQVEFALRVWPRKNFLLSFMQVVRFPSSDSQGRAKMNCVTVHPIACLISMNLAHAPLQPEKRDQCRGRLGGLRGGYRFEQSQYGALVNQAKVRQCALA